MHHFRWGASRSEQEEPDSALMRRMPASGSGTAGDRRSAASSGFRKVGSFPAGAVMLARDDSDGAGVIRGEIPYGVKTIDGDSGHHRKFQPGCFSQALANPALDLRCLFNLSVDYVLGRESAETLSLDDGSGGLSFTVKIPDTSYAHDLVTLIERGDVTECTIAFYAQRSHFEQENDGSQTMVIDEAWPLALGPSTFGSFATITSDAERAIARAHASGFKAGMQHALLEQGVTAARAHSAIKVSGSAMRRQVEQFMFRMGVKLREF